MYYTKPSKSVLNWQEVKMYCIAAVHFQKCHFSHYYICSCYACGKKEK